MFVKILTVFGLLWQLSAADDSNLFCKDLNPQNSLSMDKVRIFYLYFFLIL